jgi:integron integrase
MSPRTEAAYVGWIRRFILFHEKRHPHTMGEADVAAFLSSLADSRGVSASTQNQALAALLFLYEHVLGRKLAWVDGVVRGKLPERLPIVLTRPEIRAVMSRLEGVPALVTALLYGSGLRLFEALELRVKDVDLHKLELHLRDGKGRKDRRTMIPQTCREALGAHLIRTRAQHQADLAAGVGTVALPDALAVKYPNANREWSWQWLFPAARHHRDRRGKLTPASPDHPVHQVRRHGARTRPAAARVTWRRRRIT